MKRIVFLAVILSVVFTASMASANTVNLNYLSVTNQAAVSLSGDWLSSPPQVYAGNYTVNIWSSDNSTNYGNFTGFCVDPATAPSSYSLYDLRGIAEGSRYEAAAWVFANYLTLGYTAPAAQIAIWELVWDWGNLSLQSGHMAYTSGGSYSAAAQALVDWAMSGIGTNFDQSIYMIAHSPTSGESLNFPAQDYILPRGATTVGPPVPVPSTVYLLGAGLLGLVGIRRRFKRTQKRK
jgi:hypothetical protein